MIQQRPRRLMAAALAGFLACAFACSVGRGADAPAVQFMRLPDHGVQPQAAVDAHGHIHLIDLVGDPNHADIDYIHSEDGGATFSKPIVVNAHPGSAIAIGTVRGPHLALGKEGRVQVAWMGSSQAQPRASGKATPMLYARLAAGGARFEEERNVIQSHVGLDGGGSIAADGAGNVYIAWHAPTAVGAGELSRHIYLVHSADGGDTFSPEKVISPDTGACGCCGLRLWDCGGRLFVLYRTARTTSQRDMTLLRLAANDEHPQIDTIGKMPSAVCVMSTAAFATGGKNNVIGAWETSGQIFASFFPAQGPLPSPAPMDGRGRGRKHPAITINAAGQILVAWTEGTGWNKGGAVAWQIFDPQLHPLPNTEGRRDGLPAWDAPAAFARPDGSFVVAY